MILIDKYNVEKLPELAQHIEYTASRHDVKMIYKYANMYAEAALDYYRFKKMSDLGRCLAFIDVLQDGETFSLSDRAISEIRDFAIAYDDEIRNRKAVY